MILAASFMGWRNHPTCAECCLTIVQPAAELKGAVKNRTVINICTQQLALSAISLRALQSANDERPGFDEVEENVEKALPESGSTTCDNNMAARLDPEDLDVHETMEDPDIHETSEVPDIHEIPEEPDIHETPEDPDIHETPEDPDIHETLAVPDIHETLADPDIHETPEDLDVQETAEDPDVHETPVEPDILETLDDPEIHKTPEDPDM